MKFLRISMYVIGGLLLLMAAALPFFFRGADNGDSVADDNKAGKVDDSPIQDANVIP